MDEKLNRRRPAERLEQDERPEDIRQDELAGVHDRAVDVRFGRKMDDSLNPLEDLRDNVLISDVAANEFVARITPHIL